MYQALRMFSEKYGTMVVGVFFLVVLVIGVLVHDNYGISWDEKTQYVMGMEAYETVFYGKEWTTDPGRRYHGTVFELFLYTLEKVLSVKNAQQVFFMRHFVSFLVFYLGVFFLYLLGRKHFKSWFWGLLPAVMLVLSPRLFGHAFFNSRDIPTMSLFILSMYTLLCFSERRRLLTVFAHALACALLVSLRMTGVLLPVLTVLFLFLQAWVGKSGGRSVRLLHAFRWSFFYCVLWFVLTICLWPLLWTHPFVHFLEAFRYMSTKGPGGFYMGEKLGYNPWHWIPVWIFISTPLLYTACFLLGCASFFMRYARSLSTLILKKQEEFLFLVWFFGPIAAVIILRAGIFDTWRHLFFIYPAFLLIGVIGVRWLMQKLKAGSNGLAAYGLPLTVSSLFIISFFMTGIFMIRNHPLEYIYFSIPNRFVEGKFELDYWGLAYREALEYILEHDDTDLIPYYPISSPGYAAFHMFTPEERSRLLLILWDNFQPKYIIDTYRETEYRKTLPEETKIHTIYVGGIDVLGIYQVFDWQPQEIEDQYHIPNDFIYFLFPQENFVMDMKTGEHGFFSKEK